MGSMIGASAQTVAGAAGETTKRLEELGVPSLVMADGPAGIRICKMYKLLDGKAKGVDNPLAGMMEFMDQEQLQMMAAMAPKPTEAEEKAPIHYAYCTCLLYTSNLLLGNYEYSGKIISSVQFDYFPYPVSDEKKQTEELLREVCPLAEEWELLKEFSYLDVDADVLWRSFETLSKGEQTKVLLAALFLNEGHFLLIDEPTNHSDVYKRQLLCCISFCFFTAFLFLLFHFQHSFFCLLSTSRCV